MDKETDILIIDDDKDLVGSMRIVLESKGYHVRIAHESKAGYARIQEKTPDLIILDVMMTSDTEGFDLAFKLRNQPDYEAVPILMVTSFPKHMAEQGPEKFQHIMGEEWPVTKFLEKPIDPEQLLDSIASLLQGD